jgi:hypothetical protein
MVARTTKNAYRTTAPITVIQNDKRRDRSSLIRRVRGYRTVTPVLALAAVLASAAPAAAEVTIGQLAPEPPMPSCSPPDSDYLQTSVTGGNLYSARAAGTITAWSTHSSGPGATYTFKVFRRTRDPDAFQLVGRASEHTLTAGLNTFSTDLSVHSGDLIGLHEEGAGPNSCTFPVPGDEVQRSPGDLDTGQAAQFAPEPDVRLNLAAVLVPSNAVTIISINRQRRNGTALLTAQAPNPGLLSIGGKGLKKSHATPALATRVSLRIAAVGKRKRKLARRGRLKVRVTVTFYPTGGDPSTQIVPVRLVQKRSKASG